MNSEGNSLDELRDAFEDREVERAERKELYFLVGLLLLGSIVLALI